jgi:hypothetical protein
MAEKALTTHVNEYKSIIHNAVYPNYACEQFQVEKPSTHIKRPMDQWFWEISNRRTQHNYTETIDYLGKNTNSKHMINQDVQWGIAAHRSKFYKL